MSSVLGVLRRQVWREGEIHLVLGHPLVSMWAWERLAGIFLSCYIEQGEQEWLLKMKYQDSRTPGRGESASLSGQESRYQTQNPFWILARNSACYYLCLNVAESVSRKCGKLWVEPGEVYHFLPKKKKGWISQLIYRMQNEKEKWRENLFQRIYGSLSLYR